MILSEAGTAPFFNVANTAGVATTRFVVDHSGSAAYIFDTHTGLNPDISLRPGQTFAFDLQKLNGVHPFVIRTSNTAGSVSDGNTYYNVGLTHVQTEGTSGHAEVVHVYLLELVMMHKVKIKGYCTGKYPQTQQVETFIINVQVMRVPWSEI